nr:hypothetical protein [Tanacetum cinerariifolium]
MGVKDCAMWVCEQVHMGCLDKGFGTVPVGWSAQEKSVGVKGILARKVVLKTKEHIEEEDSRALKRLSESQEDKTAKKQKLDEEVPVVDYEIYTKNNKPYYKFKRADSSHQLYRSFLSMLRNFDREDLEVLWNLVKEIFAFTKPNNFSNDFLLTTLGAMFEKPVIQAQI